ncbi:hypothetical protein [Glycomyces salinus]|uniref:hypothetical protein n=1 Tax=Glycomyces salinus TaxID=980294 RepID=UPI0018ED4F0C|nr:hypothetical protein [Glycomyces salinus]
MRIKMTAVLGTLALFAAGCAAAEDSGAGDSATEDSGAGDSIPLDPVEDRPTYTTGVTTEEFCPTGEEIEALSSTPESPQVRIWYNGTVYPEGGVDPAPEKLYCDYFYMAGDAPEDRITDDIATPVIELRILEERPDPEDGPAPDPAEFPEFPAHFTVTGWDHTATEEEPETCLEDADDYRYGDCEDGETLLMEIFTLTGYDANLEVELQVEYRYAGEPAAPGTDRAAEIESHSRQIAAELLPVLTDRVPTTDSGNSDQLSFAHHSGVPALGYPIVAHGCLG